MVCVKLELDVDVRDRNRPCGGTVAGGGESTGIKNRRGGRYEGQDAVEMQRECGGESTRRSGPEVAMFGGLGWGK